ncbi:MAG: DUF3179 domain-containing protein [Burkholderiales bacterium]
MALLRPALTALVLLATGVNAGWAANAAVELNGFDLSGALVPVAAIERGGPPKDGIPAIDNPKFIPATQARLKPDDRILGVYLNGIARAYPVRILNWHEVVNDRLGADSIAVTYCPLCGTGMAYQAKVTDRVTTFGVSGLLYNSDVLLYDRATQSLWSQIMRIAVSGPLKGTRLIPVLLTHTSWADWRARHLKSEVLSTDTGFARDYDRDPYAGYEQIQRLLFDVQYRDARFPLKEWVLGLELGGVHKAYPFSVMERRTDANGMLRDNVGGQSILIRFSRTHRTAEAFDAKDRPLPSVMAFWFAWVAFHPQTDVLREP